MVSIKSTKYEQNSDLILHYEDGPAIAWDDGSEDWKLNGVYHRMDGPSVTRSLEHFGGYTIPDSHDLYFRNGLFYFWYISGSDMTKHVVPWMDECRINHSWQEWTDDEKVLFRLRFSK